MDTKKNIVTMIAIVSVTWLAGCYGQDLGQNSIEACYSQATIRMNY